MKKLLTLIFGLLFACATLHAQAPQYGRFHKALFGSGAPVAGTCTDGTLYYRSSNNKLYVCESTTFVDPLSGATLTAPVTIEGTATYGIDMSTAVLTNDVRFSNSMTLLKAGTNAWDGLKITKSTTTGPTTGNEGVGLFIENNRTATIDDQATVTGLEAVARSRSSGVNLTIRGGHFRTYVDDTLSGTAITSVGIDGSARASGSVVAAPGTAFVGIRSYMAPGFTGGSLPNVTNFHAFWAYNESASQAVTNVLYASSAAGGFTNGVNLSGATIAAGGCQHKMSNGACIYVGAQTTRAAVRAEVGDTNTTIGSVYLSTAGKMYFKVTHVPGDTDWERVTTSAAD